MRILGIETSCDETAIAIVSGQGDRLIVEKNVVLSQIPTHQKYGGVVPEVAAREHVRAISPMINHELPRDGAGIDVIAVTAGPGLSPALRIGVEVAKTLAVTWQKPLIALSHLEGHIYANWLGDSPPFQGACLSVGRGLGGGSASEGTETPQFPALCLVVSGGHTELILMKDHGVFERLGETLDDAVGEAFDKVASMLGLPYPGGPAVSLLAEGGDIAAFNFPRGLLDRDDFDFSFSGVKTSVLYTLRKNEDKLNDQTFRKNIAASFQEAAVDVLVQKTMRAAEKCQPASIVLAGGVAANKSLRERLQETVQRTSPNPSLLRGGSVERGGLSTRLYLPAMKYATDNAAMMAAAGYFRAQDEKNFVDPLTLAADSNLDIV